MIFRHAQDQLKQNEHRWQKEKEELVTKNKHDKQLLDKLTKDRSCFETRWLINMSLRCLHDIVFCNFDFP